MALKLTVNNWQVSFTHKKHTQKPYLFLKATFHVKSVPFIFQALCHNKSTSPCLSDRRTSHAIQAQPSHAYTFLCKWSLLRTEIESLFSQVSLLDTLGWEYYWEPFLSPWWLLPCFTNHKILYNVHFVLFVCCCWLFFAFCRKTFPRVVS